MINSKFVSSGMIIYSIAILKVDQDRMQDVRYMIEI